ncbi:MAG: succinylglutamate desuccinylase/aspartoacylase family protein [Alphaproteobacteria bacterium]|nr:MAG: succinylglutamate desuccinylase/aspartoacylase family protein [Alphaproteobacteria bacterium]
MTGVGQKLFAVIGGLFGLLLMVALMTLPGHGTEPAPEADQIGGVQVVSSLDVSALKPGRYNFYFDAGWRNSGQTILVPVIVLKGAKPGPRLLLTAAVHGDELNGIRVIQRLADEIATDTLEGTVLALPGVNQTGMNANSRYYVGSSGGGFMVDLNREFPGRTEGGGTAELFAGRLWTGLLAGQADIVVDLHTQTQGSAYPLFVFADFSNSTAQEMAYALMPDIIKNDPGQKGTLETTFMEQGIPAVTFEIGAPKQFQKEMIDRAVAGVKNLMIQQGLLPGTVRAPKAPPFVGSSYTNIYAGVGGIAVLHVALNQNVEKDQLVAVLYDPFGREIERYYAPHDGRVLAIATDPLREAGAMLVRILQ